MANETYSGRKTDKTRLSYNSIENALGNTGKVPPQAIEFEKAVLGALMLDKSAIDDVVSTLKADMFYTDAHQMIYNAIITLAKDNQPVDLLTVSDILRKEKKLEFVGGISYLAMLTHNIASAANIEYHARVVRERFVLRQLISICGEVSKQAYDDPQDVLELLDSAETQLFNIVDGNFSRQSKEIKDVAEKAINDIIQIQKSSDGFNGVPTGLRDMDAKIGGWQNSDLIVVAARPGMGKTSFILSIARNAAIDFQKSVAIFSLEMSASQLAHRLFAIESGIPAEKISKGRLNDDEWSQLMNVTQVFKTDKLIIDDTPGLSIFDLRAKCRRLKHKYDIQLVIIDYLQLMHANSDNDRNKQGNREQEIRMISQSLKELAKDLNIPVIALAQLSRAVETRSTGSKIPQLSDLRESGAIEQDADQVMFIYRPEYYGFESFPDNSSSAGRAQIIIAKNRHGATDNVYLRWLAQFTKFADDLQSSDFGIGDPGIGLRPNFEENSSSTHGESTSVLLPASFNNDTESVNIDGDFPY